MRVGSIIRNIRINKHIASKDLYNGLLSRPAIVKFEKGMSDTTVEKFFIMLQRLNITLEEFEVTYNQKENTDLMYTQQYIEAFYRRDVILLERIAEKAEKDFLLTSNIKYEHYRALCLLLIDDINKTKKYIDQVQVLKDYLLNCENWGYYEITLFTNSLSFYSSELIDLVYGRVAKTLHSFQLKRYRNEMALLLFNIIEQKLINKEIQQAKLYLEHLNAFKINIVDNMYIQTITSFFSDIINLLLGDFSKHDKIITTIKCVNFLELHNKAIQLLDFYKEILKLYKLEKLYPKI